MRAYKEQHKGLQYRITQGIKMNKNEMITDLIMYYNYISAEYLALDAKRWVTLDENTQDRYLALSMIRDKLEYVIRKLVEIGGLNDNV